jgi:peptidoglycan/xylan/chitin deacetylase (PgdA/CDA1 family)
MLQLFKRTVKWLLSAAVFYSGWLNVIRFYRSKILGKQNWAVLTYHNIVGIEEKRRADTQPGMCVLTPSFDAQMRYISRAYKVVSTEKLVEMLRAGVKIPDRTIAITFDDGWRDNYTEAFPVLKKYKIPAMIFLATDLVKSGKIPPFLEVSMLLSKGDIWPQKALKYFRQVADKNNLAPQIPQLDETRYALMARNPFHYMTALMMLDYQCMGEIVDLMLADLKIDKAEWRDTRWMINTAEIKEMSEAGIEFGSHGESHDLMVLIDLEQVKKELKESKKYIEDQLGKPVNVIAYPNGDYNDAIKREVQAAGYLGAMAFYDNLAAGTDIYAIGRYGLSEGACQGPFGKFSKAIFACKIAKVF